MQRHHRTTLAAALLLAAVGANAGAADEPAHPRDEVAWPGMTKAGSVLLPNGWSLKPAGRTTPLGDFPVNVAVHPSEPILAVLHAGYGEHEVVTLDAESGKVIGRVALPQLFAGLAWSPDGKKLYASGGFDRVVYAFDHADGLLSNRRTFRLADGQAEGKGCFAGLSLSEDGKNLYVADAFAHALIEFDTESGKLARTTELGDDSFPFGTLADSGHDRVYVSLWGQAKVAIVDMSKPTVLGHYETQEHPNEMLLGRGGDLLYVANANRNTVTVIDTAKGKPIETIQTAISPDAPPGSTPSSLALTPDGSILFVANANTNDVAAVNVEDAGHSRPLGFIPAGWYPTSVRVARDGKTLWIANGKGNSSRANRDGPMPTIPGGSDKTRQYIGGLLHGTLSIVPMPTPQAMATYSQIVYECSPLKKDDPKAVGASGRPDGSPIPAKPGNPSPIKYCIYVIKENRTYDQVFGDLPEGNGEPKLCLFPERVTPNLHALVKQFVLLDNFYVDSEVSADGHEWTMGAYATDFVERLWPISYRGDKRAPYPAEGAKPVFSVARPSGGYLWDKAKEKGVSYRSYGEFVTNGDTPDDPCTTNVAALEGHFDPQFRSYDLDYPDVKRTRRFLEEVAQFEKNGDLPQLCIVRLPNDHTYGTRPGKPTPTAMVAENDLAVGLLIEGLSKSKFWDRMAVFIVEDDAQNGSDHVDAHRTTALVIGPHVKHGTVDSTLYSTSSMLRTMELILGLEPMSQFDAAARPMWNAFAAESDPAPYMHKPTNVDVNELNDKAAWGAELSEKLNLAKEDAADDLLFNEIIWRSVKNSPMPPPVRAAFVLPRPKPAGEDEDDD